MGGLAWMQRVAADSLISISANAPVTVPTLPATISVPADGASVNAEGVMVAGSCPIVTPQAVVELDVDGTLAGTGICDGNNDFTIPVSLGAGTHELVTHILTIIGDSGPYGTPTRITASVAANTKPAAPGETLTTDKPFISLSADKNAIWTGTLQAPEGRKLIIHWGDDSNDAYTLAGKSQRFSHHYANFGSYNALFLLQDSSGTYHQQQYAVAAYTTAAAPDDTATLANSRNTHASTAIGLYGLFVTLVSIIAIIRLHAAPFAYADIMLRRHAKN
jgi:hypothetical protein